MSDLTEIARGSREAFALDRLSGGEPVALLEIGDDVAELPTGAYVQRNGGSWAAVNASIGASDLAAAIAKLTSELMIATNSPGVLAAVRRLAQLSGIPATRAQEVVRSATAEFAAGMASRWRDVSAVGEPVVDRTAPKADPLAVKVAARYRAAEKGDK